MPPASGSFAERIRAPSDFICHKPSNLSFIEVSCRSASTDLLERTIFQAILFQAAAVPLVGLTCQQSLTDNGLQRGDNICVLGASGGTGHIAVQLAKSIGARVTAGNGAFQCSSQFFC